MEFGTYGGSDFDRDGMSVPARSDTALRVTYSYNDDGTLKEVTDPKGIVTRTEYDALGRRTKVIANYTDGTPGGGTYGDEDQTVSYAYTDGLQVTITADLPSPQTDQVTTYTYGVTKGSSAGDSKIASGAPAPEGRLPRLRERHRRGQLRLQRSGPADLEEGPGRQRDGDRFRHGRAGRRPGG